MSKLLTIITNHKVSVNLYQCKVPKLKDKTICFIERGDVYWDAVITVDNLTFKLKARKVHPRASAKDVISEMLEEIGYKLPKTDAPMASYINIGVKSKDFEDMFTETKAIEPEPIEDDNSLKCLGADDRVSVMFGTYRSKRYSHIYYDATVFLNGVYHSVPFAHGDGTEHKDVHLIVVMQKLGYKTTKALRESIPVFYCDKNYNDLNKIVIEK